MIEAEYKNIYSHALLLGGEKTTLDQSARVDAFARCFVTKLAGMSFQLFDEGKFESRLRSPPASLSLHLIHSLHLHHQFEL